MMEEWEKEGMWSCLLSRACVYRYATEQGLLGR
jgi:hypothetical protein